MTTATIILECPPFNVRDRPNSLKLCFNCTIHLVVPETHVADELWRSLTFLPSLGLALSLKLVHNDIALDSTSPVLQSWARSIAEATMWKELKLITALSIYPPSRIEIGLIRSTACETHLPTILSIGRVEKITMDFEFADNGKKKLTVERMMPLTDLAVQSFWLDKMSIHTPALGRPGWTTVCDERIEFVSVIAGILSSRRKRPDKESESNQDFTEEIEEKLEKSIEAKIWQVVLKHMRTPKKLTNIQCVDGESMEVDMELLQHGSGTEFEKKQTQGKQKFNKKHCKVKNDSSEDDLAFSGSEHDFGDLIEDSYFEGLLQDNSGDEDHNNEYLWHHDSEDDDDLISISTPITSMRGNESREMSILTELEGQEDQDGKKRKREQSVSSDSDYLLEFEG
ncbi:hypothetical protein EDC01DRAFT_750627 [Geopyxis carbonaria]|nr:hypothetical protein EDC01DRAFT_750627 [Geopyxis carbonaria]